MMVHPAGDASRAGPARTCAPRSRELGSMLRLAMRRCVRSVHQASVHAQGGGDAIVKVRRVGRVTDGRL